MMERIRIKNTGKKRVEKGEKNKKGFLYVGLTIISLSLLTVGAGYTQNAVDGVGSYGVVGGAGHRRRGRAGH